MYSINFFNNMAEERLYELSKDGTTEKPSDEDTELFKAQEKPSLNERIHAYLITIKTDIRNFQSKAINATKRYIIINIDRLM